MALVSWILKVRGDDRVERVALAKARRDEKRALYITIYSLFEKAIAEVRKEAVFTLREAFSECNAKVRLLAPAAIAEKYMAVALLFEEWSGLYVKSMPRKMKVGDSTFCCRFCSGPRRTIQRAGEGGRREVP